MIRLILSVIALVLSCAPLRAQEPDRRGEVALDAPRYRGVTAYVPIPKEMHQRNEGGRCVIASVLCNGLYQQIPDLKGGKDSRLWKVARGRSGGYSPDRLERLLKEVMPEEKWVSYLGRDRAADSEVLTRLSRRGYPIGATMNTGQLYHYMPIHHMISLTHYETDQLACVVDNNDPGVYHWMPAPEFLRRWYDGGQGWAFVWSRLPPAAKLVAFSLAVPAAALLLMAAAALAGGSCLIFSRPPSQPS